MKRTSLAAALLLITLTSVALAGYGSEDPRLQELYASFVGPCCWRDNLTIHESGKADQMRADIKAMVAAGQSDKQIKAAMVQQYGKRILVVPEGGAASWLFKTPWMLGLMGLALVVVFLRRMRHAAPAEQPAVIRAD
ncbi:MAG: cytochrome c-type biogenesis protein CcmH [Candidatus Krumholzibacteria bacterium]|nr:cytochrome c-type biogenesis protein CcmH [Candidatus Krumholzibacteria bacterium]MDH4335701.1 cytochrome c-type biogenesis protein CcmH [Candidatus Krumholzibacteria bacterium]MDH5270046.1 cytochrome c-type biogenesis protein CcmH [Candidatus Krumholzibacteria bacterium]MDH5627769.1 cytochrome c-type biogenesis protein CcmH [Candidatus Krumholzibacteria bacterium]